MEKKFIFSVWKDGTKLYRAYSLNGIFDYKTDRVCFWSHDFNDACPLNDYDVIFLSKNALSEGLRFAVDIVENPENE